MPVMFSRCNLVQELNKSILLLKTINEADNMSCVSIRHQIIKNIMKTTHPKHLCNRPLRSKFLFSLLTMAAATAESCAAASTASAEIRRSMLNRASSTEPTWQVDICNPCENKYGYTWKGKTRQGTNFLCILICASDPRQYCYAQFKKTFQNKRKYEEALKAYQNGARFKMSKVAFFEDANAAYVSSPLKTMVDLSNTKMELCIGAASSAVQPAPEATIAASTSLASNQFFDVTGFVQEDCRLKRMQDVV